MKNVSELENRQKIFNLISRMPGIHFREIQRLLGIEVGTLDYHLNRMVKDGLIYVVEERYYKRYYAKDVDARDFELMAVLRQEKLRHVVLFLLLNPGKTHMEIAKALALPPSTTSFYLNLLCKKGVVKAQSKEKTVYFVADRQRTANALIRYRQSFLDKLVDRFLEIWLESGLGEKI